MMVENYYTAGNFFKNCEIHGLSEKAIFFMT
jgi:hypothetical protein